MISSVEKETNAAWGGDVPTWINRIGRVIVGKFVETSYVEEYQILYTESKKIVSVSFIRVHMRSD